MPNFAATQVAKTQARQTGQQKSLLTNSAAEWAACNTHCAPHGATTAKAVYFAKNRAAHDKKNN